MNKLKNFFFNNRLYCGIIPGLNISFDVTSADLEEPKTGIERIQALLKLDQNGNYRSELLTAFNLTFFNGIISGLYGGSRYSKHARETFIVQNEATKFISQYEAKRKLQDYVALHFLKHFFLYTFKGMLFGGIVMYTLVIVAAYRDKHGILEYAIAGFLAGAISRINNGLLAAGSGGIIGCALLTFIGGLTRLYSKWTGVDVMEEIQALSKRMEDSKLRAIAKGKKKTEIAQHDEIARLFLTRMEALKKRNEDKVFVLIPNENSEKKSKSAENEDSCTEKVEK